MRPIAETASIVCRRTRSYNGGEASRFDRLLRVIAAKATVINEIKAQTLDQMRDQNDAFSGISRPPALLIGLAGANILPPDCYANPALVNALYNF